MRKGIFWCINHNTDEPSLISKAVECDINGNVAVSDVTYTSKSGANFNHKIEWKNIDKSISKGKDFNYYPRGRVEVKNSGVIIYLNPDINNDLVIGKIIEEFDLKGVGDIKIKSDGSKHYEYIDMFG